MDRHSRKRQNGLSAFKKYVRNFEGVSAWAAGGALSIPFLTALAGISPSWPPGIVGITAVVELVALIFVYQFFCKAPRAVINRVLLCSAIALALFGTVFLGFTSLFTYEAPENGKGGVKGFACTSEASTLYPKRCPWLGDAQLENAEWEAEDLWTPQSIAAVRIALLISWSAAFVALSSLVGSFVVYQARVRS